MFRPQDLQQCLVELSRPNSAAWASMESQVDDLRNLRGEALKEPILGALHHWAAGQTERGLREQKLHLSPTHSFWLQKAPTTPLGFARLMVETARRLSLRNPEQTLTYSLAACRYLKNSNLRSIDAQKFRHLRGLAIAYHADNLRALGRHQGADKLLAVARHYTTPNGPAEMCISILEIWSAQLRDSVSSIQAVLRLERGAALLGPEIKNSIPGRWSQLQLCRSRLHLYNQRSDLTEPLLQDALDHLPRGLDLELRFEILHCLAAAKVGLGRYEAAARLLQESAPLTKYSHAELYAQRHWLEGMVALRTGDAIEAANLFRQAFDGLDRLGRWYDALKSLSDYTEACHKSGQLPSKEAEIQALIRLLAPPERLPPMAQSKLRELRKKLAQYEIEI